MPQEFGHARPTSTGTASRARPVDAAWSRQLLSAISHELRTPMTGILGMLDLLAETKGQAERMQYVEALRLSAQALMTAIERLPCLTASPPATARSDARRPVRPRCDRPRASAPGTGSRPADEPAPSAPPRALSILVAEDNAISQMLVATLMRRKGHRVTCVDNGRRAVEAALAMPFDCILMDMQMPEVDGIQATRSIREAGGRNALIPIIALTADAVPERRRFYETIGLSGFLTKPVDREELFKAIDSIASAPPVRGCIGPAPAIDLKQIEEIEATIGARKAGELLEMACAELRTKPRAIRELAERDDLAELRSEAHSLKGAVSSLGLIAVARAAKAVELALPGAELLHSLDRLESEVSRALLAVRSLLAGKRKRIAAGA